MDTNTFKNAADAEKIWSQAYDVLWPLINHKKLKVGAEIGVAFGGHSERILQKTSARLYCIDPYRHFKGYDDPMNKSQAEFNQLYSFAKNRLNRYGKRVKFVRKTSAQAASVIRSPLDFVYIDADHCEAGIKRDLNLWFIKVRDGGIIAGHDYNHPNFPGIKNAVDDFFARFNWPVHTHKSGVWWVEKLPIGISFIIPAYNCSQTIGESLKSIYQTNFSRGDEVVVVDDGSKDDTGQLVQKLSSRYQNLKIISHKTNRGGGAARNTAVKNSKNSLIFCLDSDNLLTPHSIKPLKKLLLETNSDYACFRQIKFFNHHTQMIESTWTFAKNFYHLSDYLSTHFVPGASGNYLYTKQAYQEAGGYPENSGALDAWGLGLRQAVCEQKICVLPNSHYLHRVGYESYYVRSSKSRKISQAALLIILPHINRLRLLDRLYLKTWGKKSWFDNIPKHPIKLKGSQ